MNQIDKMTKKTNFGPNFGQFASNLDPLNFFAGFTSASN